MPKEKKQGKIIKKSIAKQKSTEDIFYDDFYPETSFTESLERILELFVSEKTSDLEVIQLILSDTKSYLEHRAGNVRHPATGRLSELFDVIYSFLVVSYFDKKTAATNKNISLGAFIELLFYCGMPRVHAIPAVAKWQKMPARTARAANEIFRKRHSGIIADKNRFKAHIMFGKYRDTHLSWRQVYGEFPCEHPKAKRAYQAAYELIEVDIWSNTSERLNQLKLDQAEALKRIKEEVKLGSTAAKKREAEK